MIKVRPYSSRDLEDMVRIFSQYERSPFLKPLQDRTFKIPDRTRRVLVAVSNGKVRGFITVGETWFCKNFIFHHYALDTESLNALLEKVMEKGLCCSEKYSSPMYRYYIAKGFKTARRWLFMTRPATTIESSPPPGYSFSHLQPGEVEQLVEAVNKAYGSRRINVACIAKWRAEDPGFDEKMIHVARYQGTIVSAVILTRRRLGDSIIGCLGPIATVPEHRRRGLASHLIAISARTARRINLKVLGLYVEEDNPAVKIYEKLGFTVSTHDTVHILRYQHHQDSSKL